MTAWNMLNVVLWSVNGLLAFFFFATGVPKVIHRQGRAQPPPPVRVMEVEPMGVRDLPGDVVRNDRRLKQRPQTCLPKRGQKLSQPCLKRRPVERLAHHHRRCRSDRFSACSRVRQPARHTLFRRLLLRPIIQSRRALSIRRIRETDCDTRAYLNHSHERARCHVWHRSFVLCCIGSLV